jgi:hypothetical protein
MADLQKIERIAQYLQEQRFAALHSPDWEPLNEANRIMERAADDAERTREYIVTVHYSLRVTAPSMDDAETLVCDMDFGPNYILDSFEITDVHESQA